MTSRTVPHAVRMGQATGAAQAKKAGRISCAGREEAARSICAAWKTARSRSGKESCRGPGSGDRRSAIPPDNRRKPHGHRRWPVQVGLPTSLRCALVAPTEPAPAAGLSCSPCRRIRNSRGTVDTAPSLRFPIASAGSNNNMLQKPARRAVLSGLRAARRRKGSSKGTSPVAAALRLPPRRRSRIFLFAGYACFESRLAFHESQSHQHATHRTSWTLPDAAKAFATNSAHWLSCRSSFSSPAPATSSRFA